MTLNQKLCAALKAKAEGATHVFIGTGGEPLFLRGKEARCTDGEWNGVESVAGTAGSFDVGIDDYIKQTGVAT
jgi:hypothetical protein